MTTKQAEAKLKEILGYPTSGPCLTYSGDSYELFEPTLDYPYCYCSEECHGHDPTQSYNTLAYGKTIKELVENYEESKKPKKKTKSSR